MNQITVRQTFWHFWLYQQLFHICETFSVNYLLILQYKLFFLPRNKKNQVLVHIHVFTEQLHSWEADNLFVFCIVIIPSCNSSYPSLNQNSVIQNHPGAKIFLPYTWCLMSWILHFSFSLITHTKRGNLDLPVNISLTS